MRNGILISMLSAVCIGLLSGCCHCGRDHGWKYYPESNIVAFYDTTGNRIGVARMIKNKNYCKPTEDHKSIEYAPVILSKTMGAPTEEEYNEEGWFRNAIQPPSPPEGKYTASTSYWYDDEENAVVARYEYADIQYGIDDFDAAMEDHLRAEREARGYTTREPDSYLASSHPRWKQDAEDWVAHRDAVMEYALQLINDVQQGLIPPPTMEEFKSGLPVIHWSIE